MEGHVRLNDVSVMFFLVVGRFQQINDIKNSEFKTAMLRLYLMSTNSVWDLHIMYVNQEHISLSLTKLKIVCTIR